MLFHLIGAVSEYGKLGLTAIANSYEEAQALYDHSLAVLDAETAYGSAVTAHRASRVPKRVTKVRKLDR